MNKKKNTALRIGDFLAGKGFYIVLIVCVAVIGASAWALFLSNKPENDAIVAVSENTPTPNGEDAFGVKTAKPPVVPTAKPPIIPDDHILLPDPTPKPTPIPTPTPVPAPATPAQTPVFSSEHSSETQIKTISDLTFITPVSGEIIRHFSNTELQYSKTMGDWRAHLGTDYVCDEGTPVLSVADGRVTELRHDDLLGTEIIIDHGFGLVSVYANLAPETQVEVGQSIPVGAVIGEVGTTALIESADPAHLHFEMRLNGKTVDPGDYLP